MEPNLNKKITVAVRREHIDEGKCGDPNHCMIKLAVADAIGIANGYVRVDATGVSITRRKDYRERAFLPKPALRAMLEFDRKKEVEPFTINLTFLPTTRVAKTSPERRAQVNAARAQRKAEGRPDKKYDMAKRLIGVAMATDAIAIDLPDAKAPRGLQSKIEALQNRLRNPMKDILAKIPGKSLTARAKAVGVSRQTMYVWADEKFRPTDQQAAKIAELTGVPVEIIRGKGGAAEL
jgi:hypothetical protein